MQRAVPLTIVMTLAALTACAAPTDPSPSNSAATASAALRPSTSGKPSPAGTWTELDDAPLARLEMATTTHDGQVWLAGGLTQLGEATTEVEAFDPASGAWSAGPPLPTGVHHAALVSDGSRLLLVGGYLSASFNQPTELVLVLEDGADAWTAGPALPQPRAAGAAAWDGSRVVYAGGVGPGGVAGDVYALAGDGWAQIGVMPRAREHLAAVSDGEGRTWLLGGRIGGLDSNLGDVDLVEGDAVTALEALPTARGGVAAFFLASVGACLTGGETPDQALRTVECIDAAGAVTTLPEMRVERHGHGAAVVDGIAYVVLGGPVPGLSAHASVERFDLDS